MLEGVPAVAFAGGAETLREIHLVAVAGMNVVDDALEATQIFITRDFGLEGSLQTKGVVCSRRGHSRQLLTHKLRSLRICTRKHQRCALQLVINNDGPIIETGKQVWQVQAIGFVRFDAVGTMQ